MDRRVFLCALASALALSGCITADNTLAPEMVQSFKLADVAVTFPADAHLNYTRAEDELATSRGVSPNDYDQVQALARTPEGAAFIRDRARARMREAFQQKVGPRLQGARPVRIEVAVKEIDVPGAVRSVLVDGSATLRVAIRLVDAKTGQLYLDLPNQTETVKRGSGPAGMLMQKALEGISERDEPYLHLCDQLAADYAYWLRGAGRTGT